MYQLFTLRKMAEGGSPGPALNQGPPDLIPDIIPVDLGKKYGHKHGLNNYKDTNP